MQDAASAIKGATMEIGRAVRAPQAPGLDVSLLVGPAPIPEARRHVALIQLCGGQAPLRVYLYVDGDLVEAWMPAPATCELTLPVLPPGRHAVTVRAIDAEGRWGGASTVVACGAR